MEDSGLKDIEFSGMNLWSTKKMDQPVIVSAILAETQYSIKMTYKKTLSHSEFG